MEINVGDYVRTKDGIIKRVIGYNPQKNNPLWETLNGNVQMKGTITKHSKDILDIIEVGDYVNGYRIGEIFNYGFKNDKGIIEIPFNLRIDSDDYIKTFINVKDIKSILTHEQFEANAYTIEKDNR